MRAYSVTANTLDREWMRAAACRGQTAVFFPPMGGVSEAALAICAKCPVKEACLDYARALPERPEGVWGGLAGKDLRWREQSCA